jgi:hypothetical protein
MSVTNAPEEICTRVMDILKQEGVSDLEAPISDEESISSRLYEDKKRALLRSHPWNFARKRTTLLGVSATSEGYTYKYLLPNDFVRLLFFGADYDDEYTDRVLEGRYILSDYGEGSARLGYIYDVQNVLHMDPIFLNCLVYDIAVDIAMATIGIKSSVITNLVGLRDRAMAQARTINGQENKPKVIDSSSGSRARGSLFSTANFNRFGF